MKTIIKPPYHSFFKVHLNNFDKLKSLRFSCFTFLLFLCIAATTVIADTTYAQPKLSFTPYIQNLNSPLLITNAGDGSDRLFIAEKAGRIKIYKDGNMVTKPFLDITNLIPDTLLQGLYSVVFAPNYKVNRTFFVLYCAPGGRTIVARYQASKKNPDSAIANSGVILLSLYYDQAPMARVGDMHFGSDGYLYISLDAAITTPVAQDGQVMLGKMLRLNVVNVKTPPYYTIPPDNPFVNDPNVLDEIWAIGLRNAWRWSFDKRSGNMWIPDLGQDGWEEINLKRPADPSGANYGWPCYEGTEIYDTTGCKSISNYTFPIFTYQHDTATGGEAIIGGYVYRGSAYPALQGNYVCADYIYGNAWVIRPYRGVLNVKLQTGIPTGIDCFGEDEAGELYAASIYDGTVYRVGATAETSSSTLTTAEAGTKNNAFLKSSVYPTLVNNSTVVVDVKEAYKYVSIIDMTGHEVMRKMINDELGRITLNLPKLDAGIYILQLIGKVNFQQKIYVAK